MQRDYWKWGDLKSSIKRKREKREEKRGGGGEENRREERRGEGRRAGGLSEALAVTVLSSMALLQQDGPALGMEAPRSDQLSKTNTAVCGRSHFPTMLSSHPRTSWTVFNTDGIMHTSL